MKARVQQILDTNTIEELENPYNSPYPQFKIRKQTSSSIYSRNLGSISSFENHHSPLPQSKKYDSSLKNPSNLNNPQARNFSPDSTHSRMILNS